MHKWKCIVVYKSTVIHVYYANSLFMHFTTMLVIHKIKKTKYSFVYVSLLLATVW